MTGRHLQSLLLFTRREAVDWARAAGLPGQDADAFGDWFVRSYPDPRFRPTYSEAAVTFYADPKACHGRFWPERTD